MDTNTIRPKKKVRIICTRTGDKFDQWWEDNLKHMIDTYSGIEYDEFIVIKENKFEDEYGTFNNLIMFDRYREDDWINLAFDLDVIIKGDCNKFLKEELHVCDGRQWQSDESYAVNSISTDIVSWSGDYSHIYQKVVDDLDYYYVKYHKGIDSYIYQEHNPKRYTDGYTSIRTMANYANHDVILFNGHYTTMLLRGWWHEYTINPKPWWN
jgi:hypothetical protein|tara:strand:+ start:1455 stop:2084 length:630 start_codon:yes stop_codon:yes gene_type:complete